MATILEFRSQSIRVAETCRMNGAESAEIVLFPGVRYERWTDEAQSKSKSKKGRRRDRLEIED